MKTAFSKLVLALALGCGTVAVAETVRIGGSGDVVYSARGQDIVVEGDHRDVVIQDDAGRVTVVGDHHDIVIEGAAEVIVEGHHNEVHVTRAGAVTLTGHHNTVTVTESRPVLVNRGEKNEIVSTQGIFESADSSVAVPTGVTIQEETEVVSTSRKLTLDGAGVTQTVEADGQDVILNGSGNKLTLTGNPTSLTVNGAMNQVKLESTLRIEVTGMQNTVTYKYGNPAVDDLGVSNVIKVKP